MNHCVSRAALWAAVFAAIYVAVLPMSNTIAVRNLALLGLLISLAWQASALRAEIKFGLPVLLWGAYLLVFPLIAQDTHAAWKNLEGQWGRGLLAMMAGAGAAVALSRWLGSKAIFVLSFLSAIPLLTHLSLFFIKALESGAMPWGYWGRETHHADLGFAAGQTVILSMGAMIAGERKYRLSAALLVVAALSSTVLARSRAGVAFAMLGGILVLLAAYSWQGFLQRRHVLLGLGAFALIASSFGVLTVKDDSRWMRMATELSAGLLGDSLRIECEGVEILQTELASRYGESRAQSLLDSVRYGDGSRMVVVRAGMDLALSHPWGSDGSRQAFQKLLREKCPEPAISMAHTHNGWIDTLLAIGWLGAGLYLWVLLWFGWNGWRDLRAQEAFATWGLVLVALSLFWLIRGFTDSVYRDHMLEMQGFVLAYALLASRMERRESQHPTSARGHGAGVWPDARSNGLLR